MTLLLLLLGALFLLLLAGALLFFLPLGYWYSLRRAGVKISLRQLSGMRMRRAPIKPIVNGLLLTQRAGLPVTAYMLEAHARNGGHIEALALALVTAKQAGVALSFNEAARADREGKDLMEYIKNEVLTRE